MNDTAVVKGGQFQNLSYYLHKRYESPLGKFGNYTSLGFRLGVIRKNGETIISGIRT